MTYYLRNGNTFSVTNPNAINITEILPVGTYTVKQDPMTGQYFLELVEGFDVPSKLYGDTRKRAERILSTFESRSSSTGALLSGEQGSGKTMLAKLLSVMGQEKGYPTIVINNPWFGEGFNVFMQTIEQPTIVIFDEFEKVYDHDAQEKMLTLLDGVYPSRKLFILTCNDKYRVNTHMRNRPGRIFYSLQYGGLEQDFIREYCADNLEEQTHVETLCRIASLFADKFNFDILKALVEEMNRYGESPQDALAMLNANPQNTEGAKYTMELAVAGTLHKTHRDTWNGNPLGQSVRAGFYDESDDYINVEFVPADLVTVLPDEGKFVFENSQGQLVLTRKSEAPLNWAAF